VVPLKSVGEKFAVNLPEFQAQQAFVHLLTKSDLLCHFWTRNLLEKRCVLTEEKLYEMGDRLEHIAQKSLRHLLQETCVSKSSAAKVTKLLKLRPCKVTAVHSLQPRDPASRIHFCNWFLQSVHGGEVDPHLIFSREKLIIAQLVKRFPIVYRTRSFITVFTRVRHGSYLERDESSPHHHTLFSYDPILSTAAWSADLCLPFRISDENFVLIFHIHNSCYMLRPSHSPSHDHQHLAAY
jgi:hypothetical protein